MDLDDVALAAIDLIGRTGAKEAQFGYLHDDVPVEQADWWAHAQYSGARLTESGHPGPGQALEALALRILTGAKCVRCGGLIALSDEGAFAFRSAWLADGTQWDIEQAAAATATAGQCRWRRHGRRWESGCESDGRQQHGSEGRPSKPAGPDRAASSRTMRRQFKRTTRRQRRSR